MFFEKQNLGHEHYGENDLITKKIWKKIMNKLFML